MEVVTIVSRKVYFRKNEIYKQHIQRNKKTTHKVSTIFVHQGNSTKYFPTPNFPTQNVQQQNVSNRGIFQHMYTGMQYLIIFVFVFGFKIFPSCNFFCQVSAGITKLLSRTASAGIAKRKTFESGQVQIHLAFCFLSNLPVIFFVEKCLLVKGSFVVVFCRTQKTIKSYRKNKIFIFR